LEERVEQRTAALRHEIAERKEAEERVREQAALLDEASDAILVCNLDSQITYWNKGAEEIYGWSAAEAVGKKISELLQNKTPQTRAAQEELLREGEWLGEFTHLTKSGDKRIIQSRWTLLRDDFGRPKAKLTINTDITEKKQSEAKFLRVQRMENIGALAGGIAHDLNNSLSPILMAADMLRTELTSEDGLKMLETMRNSAQRGSDMVRQILSFSRGASGEHAVLQLKHLISDMEKFAKSTFPRSIRVQTRISAGLLPISGDATQLHQVLLNLYVNARDAMPDGGVLRIEAENVDVDSSYSGRQSAGPHVLLRVSDTGVGIPHEILNKIFEPFFTTKELGKGTGLGLSTVVGIIKTHGGFLEVSSEVGKGTLFRIFLPAVLGEVNATKPSQVVPPSGSGELVLIVDDEKAILEMAKLMLEAYNYRTLTAIDGVEAVARFREHHKEIKAVVTDFMMPNMTGPELIKKLEQIDAGVKVIGMSGLGSEVELKKMGREFPTEFLKKPFSPQTLLVKLHELLSGQ
jgi:PAS domain S-box-containing protein